MKFHQKHFSHHIISHLKLHIKIKNGRAILPGRMERRQKADCCFKAAVDDKETDFALKSVFFLGLF